MQYECGVKHCEVGNDDRCIFGGKNKIHVSSVRYSQCKKTVETICKSLKELK